MSRSTVKNEHTVGIKQRPEASMIPETVIDSCKGEVRDGLTHILLRHYTVDQGSEHVPFSRYLRG